MIQPEVYVGKILTYKGPGSVFSLLENYNLVRNVDFEYVCSTGIAFFILQFELTRYNEHLLELVINTVFQVRLFSTKI